MQAVRRRNTRVHLRRLNVLEEEDWAFGLGREGLGWALYPKRLPHRGWQFGVKGLDRCRVASIGPAALETKRVSHSED